MKSNSVKDIQICKVVRDEKSAFSDVVAIERPLKINICNANHPNSLHRLALTMCTPGDDEHLAVGYLFAERIIDCFQDVSHILHNESDEITVALNNYEHIDWNQHERSGVVSSSCGVCGKTEMDNYLLSSNTISQAYRVKTKVLYNIPGLLKSHQDIFSKTGGVHGSALMRDGQIISYFEDVGRHNALDKLGGYILKSEISILPNDILILSGRVSFELIQKADRLGFRIVTAFGAPSSLAIDIATRTGILLIGFLNENSFNIYTCNEDTEFID
ncbi:MAG TPA: formate dehydrogenase accessory sulfurtransferase FdhD [Saprospiraceae bacterium]|nr:formate dehydrogenase accessory sulfurtransferase FdhD [Saprospiraceae bacterium]MCB9327800.1 formate dehydrogenase accessory sulfurtransferase FdhD [Lewinellaceae bacterium]HRX27862.1 formate dehydrogenase accessory sulfurtransferase FdhD [Saprospiraceae bacterium]